jgi:hypothetical protein
MHLLPGVIQNTSSYRPPSQCSPTPLSVVDFLQRQPSLQERSPTSPPFPFLLLLLLLRPPPPPLPPPPPDTCAGETVLVVPAQVLFNNSTAGKHRISVATHKAFSLISSSHALVCHSITTAAAHDGYSLHISSSISGCGSNNIGGSCASSLASCPATYACSGCGKVSCSGSRSRISSSSSSSSRRSASKHRGRNIAMLCWRSSCN